MKQFRDIYFHGFSLCFFDNPFEMNIEKLEAKVEAVESQLGEVVLLFKEATFRMDRRRGRGVR